MTEHRRVCIRCGREPDVFVAHERCRCNHCGLDFVGVATEIAPALLEACKEAYRIMCILHSHDGGCGWDPDNPLPTLLRDAISKAKE